MGFVLLGLLVLVSDVVLYVLMVRADRARDVVLMRSVLAVVDEVRAYERMVAQSAPPAPDEPPRLSVVR